MHPLHPPQAGPPVLGARSFARVSGDGSATAHRAAGRPGWHRGL